MTIASDARVYYVDSSAIVKLLLEEQHSGPMRSWWAEHAVVVSDLTSTEVRRVIRRVIPERDEAALALLGDTTLIDLRASSYELAARLSPPSLRTLDAIHLAVALEIGADLAGIVTYDDRLAAAARSRQLRVVAPA